MTDIEREVKRQLAEAEKQDGVDQEAIVKFANEVSEKIIEELLPYQTIFNGLTIVLTTFLIEYCFEQHEKGQTLHLDRLDASFEHFVKGLENSIRTTVEALKAQSDAQEQKASNDALSVIATI